ncbi:hypothetical protein KYB31_15020 [Clostridium felsineum]|uniref:hypothetical protein n=1 Tax=Clostridium felsineum TaxID=36839 RepID=UPI00214D25C1|nr:hypothetical protein [Clostridium felsineum]MCR3760289.1 hypothetical protein [Clostridium felsineum]
MKKNSKIELLSKLEVLESITCRILNNNVLESDTTDEVIKELSDNGFDSLLDELSKYLLTFHSINTLKAHPSEDKYKLLFITTIKIMETFNSIRCIILETE